MAGIRRHSAKKSQDALSNESPHCRPGASLRSKWVAAALLAPAALAVTALSSADNFAAVSSVLADPLSVFAERSPGARATGALAQSKPALKPKPVAKAIRPPAFSPRKASPTQGAGEIDLPAPSPVFEAIDPGQPGQEDLAEEVGFATFAPGPSGGGAATGFFIEGLGGGAPGGGGLPTGGEVPLPNPAPVSAVPEPQTWLMMLVGFFLLGSMLRSRRSAQPVRAREPSITAKPVILTGSPSHR